MEEVLLPNRSRIIEQDKFTYSPLGKSLKKQTEMQVDALKSLNLSNMIDGLKTKTYWMIQLFIKHKVLLNYKMFLNQIIWIMIKNVENLWFKYYFNWFFKRKNTEIRKYGRKLTLEVADNEQDQLVNELNGVDNGVKPIKKNYFLNIIGLFLAARIFINLIKGISRLISNEMSNIYLKVNIEKNWHSQNSII